MSRSPCPFAQVPGSHSRGPCLAGGTFGALVTASCHRGERHTGPHPGIGGDGVQGALGCPLASRLHLKAGGLWQAPHDVLWVLQSSSVTQGPRGPSGGSWGTGRQPWPGSCHPEPCDFGQLATSAPRQQNGKSP